MELSAHLLYEALRIRLIEEKIIEIYPSDVIQSPVHLSIGQEAVAVGICHNLKVSDWVFINYRGHAFYLAKGGPLPEFFAELMGRSTGLSKGKAGSMHLAAPAQGIIGASAVVASTISHAVGAALASRIKGEHERVFVANFGDGAMEQGVFFESLNFASLHNLPVLFLCEDNGLAVHTPQNQRQSFDTEELVNSFKIPFLLIENGFDPSEIAKKSAKVIEEIRMTSRPMFLKVRTERYREHVGPGEDFDSGYRSEQLMDAWKSNDPLCLESNEIQQFKRQIRDEIEKALEFAMTSPSPGLEELLTDVI
jgi:TPP-dependent pyruvate/acetoin dehydrogenase alpha subunit